MTASDVALDAYLRSWASSTDDSAAKGVNFKSARWALSPTDARTVDARAFARACAALVDANATERFHDGPLTLVYATTTRERDERGTERMTTVRLGTTATATATTFGVVKAAAGDARAIGMVYEDERKRKLDMYDAETGETNAFRENSFGRATCAAATRRADGGRRGGRAGGATAAVATNGKMNGTHAKRESAGAATVTAGKTPGTSGKKGQSAPKTKEPGAPKSHSLAAMFANAKPKAKAVEKMVKAPTPKKANVRETTKAPTPTKSKAPASAEAAILAEEESASEDDSDDEDIGAAKRKPRRRAMAIDSEDEEEEEEAMEIADDPEPTPKSTPKKTPKSTPKKTPKSTPKKTPKSTPKKTPKSTPKRTPPSSKRKTRSTPTKAEENDENAADAAPSEPNSRPQSATKRPKKEKPLSKKALLARRIKKTIEFMDEETGEEIMKTIYVDEFDNELNEDGTFKDPENVKTSVQAS